MSSHVCPGCGHLNGAHLIGCSLAGESGEQKSIGVRCYACWAGGRGYKIVGGHSPDCEFIVRPKPGVMDPFVPSDPEDPEVQAMVDAARGHYEKSVRALAESAPEVDTLLAIDCGHAEPTPAPGEEAEYGELAVVLPDEDKPMLESVILKPKRVHPDASTVHEVEVHFGIRPHSLARALKRFGMSKDLLGGGIAAAVERYLLECGCAARYRVDVTLSLQEGCAGVTLVKRGGN